MRFPGGLILLLLSAPMLIGVRHSSAALKPAESSGQPRSKVALSRRLSDLRTRIISVEQDLIASLKQRDSAKENLRKIRELMNLQKQERELGSRRMKELESTIAALESRRTELRERIGDHRTQLRGSLVELSRALREGPGTGIHLPEGERLAAPRRRVLGARVAREVREIEALRVDLADADQLELRIREEKEHLAYLFQDLKEKESVLELNRQLQADLLERRNQERIARLESYQKLKSAEAQVEKLIGEFNARIELEKSVETERIASKAMMKGLFAKMKGRLPMPVEGKLLSRFGRHFDSESRLYVFKKGVDIGVPPSQQVRAVAPGRVAYAGELPSYGRVMIVDHGDHFYSLCANLGELSRQVGDAVKAGDVLGSSDPAGTPVYFEIRSRNVAVNPLQWLAGSFNLAGYGEKRD